MSHSQPLDARSPLTADTPMRVRLTRGIAWAWRFEFVILAVCGIRSAMMAGSWDAWAAFAVPLALVSAAAATGAGILAALAASGLAGYARACFLGALLVAPIVAAAAVQNDGTVRPLSGSLAVEFMLGGAAFGAASQARRGPTGWPVGTDWP